MDCNTFPEARKTLLSCNQGDLISTVVAQAGAGGEGGCIGGWGLVGGATNRPNAAASFLS